MNRDNYCYRNLVRRATKKNKIISGPIVEKVSTSWQEKNHKKILQKKEAKRLRVVVAFAIES